MKNARTFVRHLVALALFAAGGSLFAQNPPPPSKLEPLPEIPPPPGVSSDTDLEPQVTIRRKGGDTVEEARVNGKVVWVKVTPQHGKPYFLIPDGAGNVTIREGPGQDLRVPLWILFSF